MKSIERIKCKGVNCYLLRGEGGAVLVDTGMKGDRAKVLKIGKDAGIKLIVLTHGHSDHAGNAAFLSKELNVPIAMHESDYKLIRDKDPGKMAAHTAIGKFMLSFAGMSPTAESFSMPIFLRDGDSLKYYGVDAAVIGLPGHTLGSIGIKAGEDFIVGDALFNMFGPTRAMFYMSRSDMEKSAARISSSGAKTIYFGHGNPVANKKW